MLMGWRGVGYLALAAGFGCTRVTDAVETVVVRDSSGVRIVENQAPAWGDSQGGWVVDPTPEIVIPGDFGEPEHYLFGIYDVVRLGDGDVVVANRGTAQLFFFDSLGRFVRAVGRRGDGPGEFQQVFGLFRCENETLVVLELSRMSVLDREGAFLNTVPLLTPGMPQSRSVDAVSNDCGAGLFWVNVSHRPELVLGVNDMVATLLWTDFGDGSRDTIATVVRDRVHIWKRGEERLDIPIPFAERATWTASGDEVVVGHGGSFELEVFGRSGRLQQVVRWHASRPPLSRLNRDEFAESLEAFFEQHPDEREYWPPVARIPLPEAKAAYTRVLSDSEGTIWVQQSGRWPGRSQAWWVFDASGRWLGAVGMPVGLRVLAIDDEFVIGVFRDEFDVEHVRLHRLTKANR
jgi:hypothetical protein